MIRVIDLKKYYGDYKALEGISFSVKKGEILGIIGENGAGKSTTLKIMAGLLRPTYGKVEYFGKDFFKNMESLKKKIGYLPEFDALYENMKPLEYLIFFSSFYGIDKKSSENIGKRLIKMFNLPEDKFIGSFSKGMMRKLSIARTLIHDPDILIYDEPTGGLDVATSIFILDLLKNLKEKGKIIVLSTHNMHYVESICDKIVMLRAGKMIYYGRIEDLKKECYKIVYKENEKIKKLFVEDPRELNDVLKRIIAEGFKILKIERKNTLEDVYMKIISTSSNNNFI